jgi:hypothetical protein
MQRRNGRWRLRDLPAIRRQHRAGFVIQLRSCAAPTALRGVASVSQPFSWISCTLLHRAQCVRVSLRKPAWCFLAGSSFTGNPGPGWADFWCRPSGSGLIAISRRLVRVYRCGYSTFGRGAMLFGWMGGGGGWLVPPFAKSPPCPILRALAKGGTRRPQPQTLNTLSHICLRGEAPRPYRNRK